MHCYHPKKLKLKTKLQIVLIIIMWLAGVLSPLYRDKIHQWNVEAFVAGFFTEKVIFVDNEVPKYNPCGLDVVVCKGEETKIEKVDELKETIRFIFGDNWRLAYAVMMAESGGNPQAVNHNNNGSVDYGIWQINTIHGLDVDCMIDVECSTKFAYKLSKGGRDFAPWVAYNNKSYKKFNN